MTDRRTMIVERIGQAHADRLCSIVGGTRLSVPANLKNIRPLANLLGDELATLMVFHFGGQRPYVPLPERATKVDARAVIRLTRRGKSASAIARILKCSDRAVHRKRADARRKGLLTPLST